MLEYYEVSPLPEVCIECMARNDEYEDCGSCDYALERWHLTPESEKRLQELIAAQKEERKKKRS